MWKCYFISAGDTPLQMCEAFGGGLFARYYSGIMLTFSSVIRKKDNI